MSIVSRRRTEIGSQRSARPASAVNLGPGPRRASGGIGVGCGAGLRCGPRSHGVVVLNLLSEAARRGNPLTARSSSGAIARSRHLPLHARRADRTCAVAARGRPTVPPTSPTRPTADPRPTSTSASTSTSRLREARRGEPVDSSPCSRATLRRRPMALSYASRGVVWKAVRASCFASKNHPRRCRPEYERDLEDWTVGYPADSPIVARASVTRL